MMANDMGHSIAGLVAKQEVLKPVGNRWKNAVLCDLSQGFCFLLFSDAWYDELTGEWPPWVVDPETEFPPLHDSVLDMIKSVSQRGKVGFVLTEYFGGEGYQGAAGWHRGEMFFEPSKSDFSPISDMLCLMSIKVGENYDEFASLGLDRYRSNEDWVEAFQGESG